MNKEQKIRAFDASSPGDRSGNIFGLPFTCEEADVVILPVPWDVTVSYGAGTSKGPEAVFKASLQVDLYDPLVRNAWKAGFAMEKIPAAVAGKSKLLRKKAEKYIRAIESGKDVLKNKELKKIREDINKECRGLNKWVKEQTARLLEKEKIVSLLGGDHSTPLGLLQAVAEKHGEFAILQIDAHADLRNAYEGFEFSHASIMHNALKVPQLKKLVQVGIRDYCDEEAHAIRSSNGRVKTFFDRSIKHAMFEGKTWESVCSEIISELPDKVYVSFDIDGLDPKLCPGTGTPVPGGFEFEQAVYLLQKLVFSGKKIIAFDINEVAPRDDEWDANVGARLLYRLCILAALSNGKYSV